MLWYNEECSRCNPLFISIFPLHPRATTLGRKSQTSLPFTRHSPQAITPAVAVSWTSKATVTFTVTSSSSHLNYFSYQEPMNQVNRPRPCPTRKRGSLQNQFMERIILEGYFEALGLEEGQKGEEWTFWFGFGFGKERWVDEWMGGVVGELATGRWRLGTDW